MLAHTLGGSNVSITPFPREGTETDGFKGCELLHDVIDNPISPRGDGNVFMAVVDDNSPLAINR